MSPNVENAVDRLDSALDRLQSVVEARKSLRARSQELENEVHTLNSDRARLADRLDKAETQVTNLGDANRDVSTRIVGAMEIIREVLASSHEER